MRTKKAIWVSVAFAVFSWAAVCVYFAGKARIVFYQNGSPLASTPISLLMGTPPSVKAQLDADGGYDFPWALKFADEVFHFEIEAPNGKLSGFSTVPRGKTVHIDSCAGGVTKTTTKRVYLGVVEVSTSSTMIDVSGKTNSVNSANPKP